ncbi:MAG: DNA polymerase ligase N-terminal domain-containing protein [Endomicrobiia bacterium]|nr:DNA polymerase ligase N-terminal domain-containing protein [Endomicrobiia bacterium]
MKKSDGKRAESYAEKRDFSRTPEPAPDGRPKSPTGKHSVSARTCAEICPDARRKNKPIFVVHKHAASRLHWDLRLERNGALESWAVPKEPPTETGVKRLAVKVEDHPLDYAVFEGSIPQGNYGAGTVEIWDSGTYFAEKYEPREILLDFSGEKLHSRYALINTDGKNWLFFKRKQ